ncbi:class I SAM-dependent methyltransferase [Sphingobium sp. AS12]|uniref:SAM-dependent methyltransferase n=1 Tax=Sphingobium sp. AS12 TaxID=2849495 RepID=UPI001C3154B5|nr:methyltransferase domain-containing protein [Sphingobium sp. AS12]MBV2150014.1 class I SAM-dependent methyltransferase [Sphingobium sp. AS12]
MTVIGPADLPEFVRKIDDLGGPGDPRVDDYWRHISYAPAIEIDTDLDPFSVAYFNAQIALYEEISGRALDQTVNEHTIFNREAHVTSRNPYNHGDPSALATQLVQLATAMRHAKPRRGARIVDMGCGWGLSSELASYLGLDVEAVDINRDFVALVSERSQRYGYGIKPIHASFDSYVSQTPVDLFLFYECLHHAVEPWTLLGRLATMLSPAGKIVACGEPINTHWWPHWGLRLDPMSIYCIHKHGWFESGWSLEFLTRCLDRALLNVQVTTDPDSSIGQFVIGARDEVLNAEWLHRNSTIEGGVLDGHYLVAGEKTTLRFCTSIGGGRSELVIHNFRPRPIKAKVRRDGGSAVKMTFVPGETRLPVDVIEVGTVLQFESETWRPSEEIGNLDTRRLAFHIGGIAPDRQREIDAAATLDRVIRIRG